MDASAHSADAASFPAGLPLPDPDESAPFETIDRLAVRKRFIANG
jgi:hypothetical protein